MPPRALVLTLGDLDRSPRMQRHAASLARAGWDVEMVGFGPWNQDRVIVRSIPAFDRLRGRGWRFVPAAAVRQAALAVALLARLLTGPRPDTILVAVPPALPSLPLVALVARLRRARLVLDWHNLTGPMLRLRMARGAITRVVEFLERAFARAADAHFAVSAPLADHLRDAYGLAEVSVVPDGMSREDAEVARAVAAPPVVIAPTSWSEDEDLSLLADAAALCDERLGESGPRVVFLVTGRGERRAAFERRIAAMQLRRITIRTAWLSPSDYRNAVASAVLGVSLHRSASGLDLAFKVTEMLGLGVPVAALDYGPVLRDQIRPGENGLLFRSAEELAARIVELLGRWPDTPELDRLRASVRSMDTPRWEDEWDRAALPLLT